MAVVPVDFEPVPLQDVGGEDGVSAEPVQPKLFTPQPVDFTPVPVGSTVEPPKEGTLTAVDFTPVPVDDTPLKPATTNPNEEPGYGDLILGAGGKGLKAGADEVGAFLNAAQARIRGEQFFQQPAPEEVPSIADGLLKTPISEGYTDPKWWVAKIAYESGHMAPIAAGAAVGGLPGAIGAATATGLLPTYKAAKARGLSDDEAINETAKMAAVTAGTFGIMGAVGRVGLTGMVEKELADGQVAQALAHPIREALVQLGVVQPAIGAAGNLAGQIVQARDTFSWEEVGESFATNIALGGVFAGPHLVAGAVGRVLPARPLGERGQPGEALRPLEPRIVEDQPIEPGGLYSQVPTGMPESPVFYSAVQQAVANSKTASAPGRQWLGEIKNAPGIKTEELEYLKLPQWLEGADGKVSKQDLLAHIEESQVRIEEMISEDLPPGRQSWLQVDAENTQYQEYTLPGRRSVYGELKFYMPNKFAVFAKQHMDLQREFDTGGPGGTTLAGTPRGRAIVEEMEKLGDIHRSDANYSAPHFKGSLRELPEAAQSDYFKHASMNENLLAWSRYTGRVDRDGKKTLFIEELQSDWHQAGRKHGYLKEGETAKELKAKRDTTIEEGRRRLAVLQNDVTEMLQRNGRLGFDTNAEARAAIARESPNRWEFNTPEDHALALRWHETAQEQARLVIESEKIPVPDAPFKSSWPELAFKRMMRYAADNGYERIAWTNGEQQVARWPSATGGHAGMREFYDKILPSIANKWAKKMGMDGGETTFARTVAELQGARNRFIDVSMAASTRIKMGLPLFQDVSPKALGIGEGKPVTGEPEGLRAAARQVIKVADTLAQKMGLPPIKWNIVHLSVATWSAQYHIDTHVIDLNLARSRTAEQLFQAAAHEVGHHVAYTKFYKLPDTDKQAVFDAYKTWVNRLYKEGTAPGGGPSQGDLLRHRLAAANLFFLDPTLFVSADQRSVTAWTKTQRDYWIGFDEFFAEQTAKWATTSEKPLSIVDRFFSALGRALRAVYETMIGRLPKAPFLPEKAMKEYLDGFLKDNMKFGPELLEDLQIRSMKEGQAAMDRAGAPETPVVPRTGSTGGGRDIADGAGAGWEGREMAAHADRWYTHYNWYRSIIQLAKLNPHIRGLVMYNELNGLMHLTGNQIKSEAKDTLDGWRRLKAKGEQENLGNFIDDYMNGEFMSPADRAKGLRKPTAAEMDALVKKHDLSPRARALFERIQDDFNRTLDRIGDLLRRDAFRIPDPLKQAEALDAIDKQIEGMRDKPYFPAFRFGDFSVTVYSKDGHVKHFETFQTARRQRQAAEELRKLADPEDKVLPGFVKKDVRPFLGMPPGLLNLMADKLKLSTSQRDAMKELIFEYAPAQSFRHRFQKKELVPGYSNEWQRAYAHYMYHFSNYYARTRFIDPMRDMIQQVWEERANRTDATKLDQIRNFMSNHLDKTVIDTRADWAGLRGMMFHWYLGFSPSAALVNMTQTPMVTLPFLGAKFGDLKAIAALSKATTDMQTFYKKATILASSDREMQAVGQAIREGTLAENQAHELAGVSEARTLYKGFGTAGERAYQQFSEYSSYFFNMAEEYNRRVAFRAAWRLANENMNAKYVQEAVALHPLQYDRLRRAGWSHQDAAAFTAAKDAVESSQYVYAPYARPKMFQGKLGSLFVFKSFLHNTLFLLGSNKEVGGRMLAMLAVAAGLGGIPFAEDVKSLIKGIGARFFGADWDVEDAARRYVLDVTKGKISSDLLLHGMGHYGFGIPQVADLAGSLLGVKSPIPSVDVSRSVGMGKSFPIDVGRLITPSKDVAGSAMRELQRASGAMFGMGFNLYNFGTSSPFGEPEWKKWEMVMPRAMANASTALRWGVEGREQNKIGNAVLRFDPTDSIQASEMIAKAMGFNPTRLSERWDNLAAKSEATAYWDIRRQVLMRQFAHALKTGDTEGRESVTKRIIEFNKEIPDELAGQKISSAALKQSLMNRLKTQQKQELGLPARTRDFGIYKEIDRLYPGGAVPPGVINIRKVQ